MPELSCSCDAGVRYTETFIDMQARARVGYKLCARCGAELVRIEIGRHDVGKYAAYLKAKQSHDHANGHATSG